MSGAHWQMLWRSTPSFASMGSRRSSSATPRVASSRISLRARCRGYGRPSGSWKTQRPRARWMTEMLHHHFPSAWWCSSLSSSLRSSTFAGAAVLGLKEPAVLGLPKLGAAELGRSGMRQPSRSGRLSQRQVNEFGQRAFSGASLFMCIRGGAVTQYVYITSVTHVRNHVSFENMVRTALPHAPQHPSRETSRLATPTIMIVSARSTRPDHTQLQDGGRSQRDRDRAPSVCANA